MISQTFLNQMNRLDKTLTLKLDRGMERYVIYRNDRKNKPRLILKIEEGGEFSYPNRNHIDKLYEMDSWQNKTLIADMDRHNDNLDLESSQEIHFLNDELSKLVTRSKYY